jgi:hypothetical protein
MKILLLGLTLCMSISAHALTCTSEDNSAKKLTLEDTGHGNGLVEGKTFVREYINLFVGKIKNNIIENVYTLYNQDGVKYEFLLKKNLPAISHCRARFCPTPVNFKNMTGKLTSVDLEDEYFSCF